MLKKILLGAMLLSAPAYATEYATGDCMAGNGTSIRYAIHQGKGFISYNNSPLGEVFTKRIDGNGNIDANGPFAAIQQIGNVGNMVLVVNLYSGRGYIITKFDDGSKTETNVSCSLGSANY